MSELNLKKAAFTRNLLLDAACKLAQTLEINELSFKRVSEQAGISQRTMFRHFGSRDEFLDALTARLYEELDLPDVPATIGELQHYITQVYQKLDAQPHKAEVLLGPELLPRVIATQARERFKSLQRLLQNNYPDCSTADITKTAANLRYIISASSWRYYRLYFGFDLQTSTECAQMLVDQTLKGIEERQHNASKSNNRLQDTAT